MREGTVTRRMASVFNELGSEFENQYYEELPKQISGSIADQV